MNDSFLETSAFAGLIGELESDLDYVDNMQVDDCYPDITQPRYKELDAVGVEDIRATLNMPPYRIWTPILVHEADDNGYKIIMGGRRWLASSLEGKDTIPALVVKHGVDSDKTQLLIQLIENTARKNLDPREEGQTFIRLKAMGMEGKDIARTRNKKDSFISECCMLAEMENDSSLAFINNLMNKKICVDPTAITSLIRIARKNKGACEKLISWAIDKDCINRKWAQSLKNVDLEESFDQQISALDQLSTSKNITKATEATKNTALNDNSSTELLESDRPDHEVALSSAVNSKEDENVVTDKPASNGENDLGSSDVFNKRPLNKAKITVMHKEILALLLLDRVDMEEGFAWITLQNGDDKPLRVSVDDITIIHVG